MLFPQPPNGLRLIVHFWDYSVFWTFGALGDMKIFLGWTSNVILIFSVISHTLPSVLYIKYVGHFAPLNYE